MTTTLVVIRVLSCRGGTDSHHGMRAVIAHVVGGSPMRDSSGAATPRRSRWVRFGALVAALLLLLVASRGAGQEPSTDAEEPPRLPPVVVIGTTPLPALGIPLDKYPGNAQSVTRRGDRQPEPPHHAGPALPQHRLGQPQQHPGQPLADRPDLPGVSGLAPDRQSHRPLDVPGRHALQQWVRRHHQLGPHPRVGHRRHHPHSRLQPDLRAEHAGRGPGRADQARLRLPGGQAGGLRRLVRALGGGRGVRRLSRAVRLVSQLHHHQRGRLARRVAQRPAPALHQGGIQARSHRRRAELRLCQQRPHRQWPGSAEPGGRGPPRRLHVPRQHRQHHVPRQRPGQSLAHR